MYVKILVRYVFCLSLPSNFLQVHLYFGDHGLAFGGNVERVFAVLFFLHLIWLMLFYDVPKCSALQGGKPYENQTIIEQLNDDDDTDTLYFWWLRNMSLLQRMLLLMTAGTEMKP